MMIRSNSNYCDTFVQDDQHSAKVINSTTRLIDDLTEALDRFKTSSGFESPVVQEISEEIKQRFNDDPDTLQLTLEVAWEKELTPAFVHVEGQWWEFKGVDKKTSGLIFESLEA